MKIVDAELKTVLDGNEEFPINDGGADKKVAISSIVALIPQGPQGPPGNQGSDGSQGIQGIQGEPGFGLSFDNATWTANADSGTITASVASESDLSILATMLDSALPGTSAGTIIANIGRKLKALEAILAVAKLPYHPA